MYKCLPFPHINLSTHTLIIKKIAVDFEEPYSAPSLSEIPWYGILGNHEYGYNVDAVLEYANINPIWVMDDRYYTK
jgi:tartrate-resistant acid phosphatase type 5